MQLAYAAREGATHDEPHDDLGALEAAAFGVLGDGELGELLRFLLQQLEELHVPRRVVEAGALPVDLVGESAGADDRDLEILGVALDRLAQRLAEIEATLCRGNRELEHSDLQRNDRSGPLRFVRPDERKWREAAVVESLRLKVRQVELIGNETLGDVTRECGMPLDRRQPARTAAFIGRPEAFA